MRRTAERMGSLTSTLAGRTGLIGSDFVAGWRGEDNLVIGRTDLLLRARSSGPSGREGYVELSRFTRKDPCNV